MPLILTEALIDEVTEALQGFREQGIRAVVLRAPPGAKVWSAGHDIMRAIHYPGTVRAHAGPAPHRL